MCDFSHIPCFVPVAMHMAFNAIGQVVCVTTGGCVDFD